MDLLICFNLLPHLHCRTQTKSNTRIPKDVEGLVLWQRYKSQVQGSCLLDPACGPATPTHNFTQTNPLLQSLVFSSQPPSQHRSVRMERRQRREGIIVTEDTGEKLRLKRHLEASFQEIIPLIAWLIIQYILSHTNYDKIILHMRKLFKNFIHQSIAC